MEKLKKILIKPNHSIKQALRQMDAMGEKTLLVIDDHEKLLGTVTDGDVRRWILKGKGLTESVFRVMNSSPFCLGQDFDRKIAKQIMIKQKLECLPVVDGNKKVISAVWWVDLFEKESKKLKKLKIPVVIMAGGEGARLAPFTKILPKPLMPIGDKPIIEIIIGRFMDYGCDDFYLSLNYKSNIIKAYFNDFEHQYKISYILENKPLGTAGGLHFLKNRIKKTFFVSNCDVLIEADYADILKFHNEKKSKITLVSSMKNFTVPYGVCDIESGGILKSIREKPEFDFFVTTGMYVLDKTVLKDIPKNSFYNMTDLISDYLDRGERVGVYPVSEKSWVDIGQLEALQEMLKKFEIQP
jgi:Nucleoside-diphosphate-sugar pyrophosphorylase involved in lipopolysaccharide biosynthesis/translation initiation factor 2B, gamma/epsilon subunits (eIF-2Bgamma/eIF-2Bepsilon)